MNAKMISYCLECGEKRGWARNDHPEYTQCEICGDIKDCFQISTDKVVLDADEELTLEALKTIMHLHAQGFETIVDNKHAVVLKKGSITVTVEIPQAITTNF